MADFSRPEYASYVQLCRELGRESECPMCSGYGKIAHDKEAGGEYAFVRCLLCQGLGKLYPTLADWLEMLEEAGVTGEVIMRCPNDPHCYRASSPSPYVKEEGHAYTREKAVARLYVALTRSPADPAPPSAAR